MSLRRSDKHRVYFEGGLGNQILALLEYKARMRNFENVIPDCTYFAKPTDFILPNGLSKWKWELDVYGHFIHDLQGSKINLIRRKIFYKRESTEDRIKYYANHEWLKGDELARLFPITTEVNGILSRSGILSEGAYWVLHQRRGDYCKIGAKTIPFSDTKRLISSISSALPKSGFFLTDEKLSDSESLDIKAFYQTQGLEVTLIDESFNLNNIELHDLMRSADFLIASNSTFSYTAGILAKKSQTTIFPSDFYGGKITSNLSTIYNTTGQYVIQLPSA